MRQIALVFTLLLSVAFLVLWRNFSREEEPEHRPRDMAPVEPSPICPWRNPDRDLPALFPTATHYVLEPRVVSGLTAAIQKKLGRLMHPDENPLRIQRATHQGQVVGSILVTRVKGEHGGIEIVIGVETNGAIRGVLVQSQREPPAIAEAITGPWLQHFKGLNDTSQFLTLCDLPKVREGARASAQAIATGVRDQWIVLGFADGSPDPREPGKHSHH